LIERQFGKMHTIRLKAEDHTPDTSADIELVVKSEVESLGKAWNLTNNDQTLLRDGLIRGADRTFLWVSLILGILNDIDIVSRERFLQILKDLPPDLDAIYEKILRNAYDQEKARRLLQIVIAAARPLTLDEMRVALSIQPHHKSIEDLESLYSFESAVKDICGLFVKVIDSKIYFIHQTAKEFLMRSSTPDLVTTENSAWKHSLCPIESSLALARSCIYYLLFNVFETNPLTAESSYRWGELERYAGKHVFLDYAAKNWAAHALEAGIWEREEFSASALEVLNSGAGRLLTWFLVYRGRTYGFDIELKNIASLTVASYIGHVAAVGLLIEMGADINGRRGLFDNALNVAASRKHKSVVELLLTKGATVYLYGGEYQNLLGVSTHF
jgi:hypothetical protein